MSYAKGAIAHAMWGLTRLLESRERRSLNASSSMREGGMESQRLFPAMGSASSCQVLKH